VIVATYVPAMSIAAGKLAEFCTGADPAQIGTGFASKIAEVASCGVAEPVFRRDLV
jgi:hypothetical protein